MLWVLLSVELLLPIFSGNGLPHNQLAVQIATQSKLVGAENFAVVFAGVGIKHDDAAYFSSSLSAQGQGRNLVDAVDQFTVGSPGGMGLGSRAHGGSLFHKYLEVCGEGEKIGRYCSD